MINTVEKRYSRFSNNFENYKVTYTDNKVVFVPLDETNTDYQAIQEWIKDGGTVIDNGAE